MYKKVCKETAIAILSPSKRIVISFFVAAILIAGDYFLDNYPYPVLDDVDTLGLTEMITNRLADEADDSVVFLNVAYDKALVPVIDDFGDTVGSTVITDRKILLRLLNVLEEADYKFLALDVRFEKGFATDSDSALWAVMSRLRDFAYSTHSGQDDAPTEEAGMAASLADYGATLSTGFTRWQFLQPSGESMPLTIYRSVDHGEISKFGPFYFDRGRLCRNTLFVPLSPALLLPERPDGEVRYPLLGGQVMRWNSDAELAAMVGGKIVVVGDFDGDTHDTYIGPVPGPALIHSAYSELHKGRHLINWWLTAFMFAIFYSMAFIALSEENIWLRFKWIRRHPFMQTLLSFIGWDLTLNILGIVLYLLFKESFLSLLPALSMTILGWISNKVYSRNPLPDAGKV